MPIYTLLVNGYFHILSAFPPVLGWFVSVIVLVAFVLLAWGLIRANALYLIILVIFLPFVIPIIGRVFSDMFMFFVFLLHQVGLGT